MILVPLAPKDCCCHGDINLVSLEVFHEHAGGLPAEIWFHDTVHRKEEKILT